tara:strand:+ start:38 stop:268 length:231 start_codon:yes stop_codon:yes gene_type:complete
MTPTLYLIPNGLGETLQPDIFPKQIKSVIEKLDYFIVENKKRPGDSSKKSPLTKNNPPLSFSLSINIHQWRILSPI